MMWSSPLLLLVLLFGLTTSATPTISPATTTPPSIPATTHTSATTIPAVPTTSSATSTPTSTTSPSPPSTQFVAATATSAKSPGRTTNASVSNVELAGSLAATLAVTDVPLSGPGAWVLTTTAPVTARLRCPLANVSFGDRIVIERSQTCQLELAANSQGASPSWRLTRVQ